MLDVLGVQVVIKIHDGFEGSEVTVEEQQQQLELSVGGTVRQTVQEHAQRLPRRVLVPCRTQSGAMLEMLQEQRHIRAKAGRETHPSLSIDRCIRELP